MKTFQRFNPNETKDQGFERACKYLLEKMGWKCELTKSSGDNGIDIVARKDDNVIGVQCKNYDEKVSNDKIRDFNGALAMYKISNGIFMTTSGFTSESIKTAETLGIDLWDYTKIKSESNKLGFDLETLKPIKEKAIKSVVLPHNVETYSKMDEMITNTNNCILIMGTGIGKTTTALEYCIQHKCRALVVCPSNIVKDSWNNNKANKNGRLVDTTTYQSFSGDYKFRNYDNYGIVIFDEVHHAGAETWGSGVKYLMDNNIKVLGLTATEERTDGNNVAETLFGNNIVEGMDLLDGIREGVVYPFTYVGALYNAENVCQAAKDKYGDKLTEVLLGEIDMALNNTKDVRSIIKKDMPKGNRKGIIFSADINSMEADIKFIKDIYPKTEIRKLHSNMSYNEQKEVKEWFAHVKTGYICNVGMVNEGAHYEGVNTVFMLRKTSSELVFLQQLGRCITSVYGHKDPKTVVFDLVNSSKAVQNVKKKFKESGVESNITAIEVTEEDYQIISDAIESGVIEGIDTEDGLIEISAEDVDKLNELEEEVNLELNTEEPKSKVKPLTRTIYVKNNPTYNADCGKSKQIIVEDYTETIEKVLERLHDYIIGSWSEEDENILRIWYPIEGVNVNKRLSISRTKIAIKARASILDIMYRDFWTEEDEKLLKENYPIYGRKITHLFSKDVTEHAIQQKARKLGLISPRIWTKEEDEIIKTFFPSEGNKVYLRLTNRTKEQCSRRAKLLKVEYIDIKKHWSPEELQILYSYYPNEGITILKRLPNKTKSQINKKTQQIGLISNNKKNWTEEEDNILKKYYPIEGKKVYLRLSGRNEYSCRDRARKLGLKYINPKHKKWTEDEDNIIKQYYEIEGANVCKRLKGRTKQSVQVRASILGISAKNVVNAAKKVYCIELQKVFKSACQASKELNISDETIRQCCHGAGRTAGGYHWKYVEE